MFGLKIVKKKKYEELQAHYKMLKSRYNALEEFRKEICDHSRFHNYYPEPAELVIHLCVSEDQEYYWDLYTSFVDKDYKTIYEEECWKDIKMWR